jgi:hypothetical protein
MFGVSLYSEISIYQGIGTKSNSLEQVEAYFGSPLFSGGASLVPKPY